MHETNIYNLRIPNSSFVLELFQGILHNVHMPYFCVPEQVGAHVVPPHNNALFG